MKTNTHFWSHLAHFFLEWELFRICRKNKNKRFMFNFFFFENRDVYEKNMENM